MLTFSLPLSFPPSHNLFKYHTQCIHTLLQLISSSYNPNIKRCKHQAAKSSNWQTHTFPQRSGIDRKRRGVGNRIKGSTCKFLGMLGEMLRREAQLAF